MAYCNTAADRSRNYNPIPGIRSSAAAGNSRVRVPSGASRTVRYGDHIFVRVTDMQRGQSEAAEFELHTVADMSEIYGELRHRTHGLRGLMRLYVRNATRGWSFEQPFKLYGPARPCTPAMSASRWPMSKDCTNPCCDSQGSRWRL